MIGIIPIFLRKQAKKMDTSFCSYTKQELENQYQFYLQVICTTYTQPVHNNYTYLMKTLHI